MKDRTKRGATARGIDRDPLERIKEIEKVLSGDRLASQAWRDLRETGFDPVWLIEGWVSYQRRETAPPLKVDFEVVVVQADDSNENYVRFVQTTRHKMAVLPQKLRDLANDATLAAWLMSQWPENLLGVPAGMRQLADWLEEHPPKIPDRRALYGPTRVLKLLMMSADKETGGKFSRTALSRKIADMLKPVAEHFGLRAPREESLLKYLPASS